MIAWQIPVLARVFFAHMVTPILLKKLTGQRSRTRSIRLMFFVCALLAVASALLTRTPLVMDKNFAVILGLGFANSFAVYALWRAIAMSLSKQALFTMMDDVIPMAMGYALLGEDKILTPMLGLGVAICLGGVAVHVTMDSRKKKADELKKKEESGTDGAPEQPWRIFVWIGIYSVIWGVAHFAFRYYAISGVTIPTFLLGWYGGAFVGSNLVMLLMGKKEMGDPLPKAQIVLVTITAVVIALCLALEYWASMYAPLTVTQPIFQVTEMIFPTLIGLFIFKEVKELTKRTATVFAIAFVGSLIITLSY